MIGAAKGLDHGIDTTLTLTPFSSLLRAYQHQLLHNLHKVMEHGGGVVAFSSYLPHKVAESA